MRIALRLRNQQWLPNVLNNYINKESVFARRRDEELHGRAVKVLDLAGDGGEEEGRMEVGIMRWSETAEI